MPGIEWGGDHAKEEVGELQDAIEVMREENEEWKQYSKKWQKLSIGLGALSLLLSVAHFVSAL